MPSERRYILTLSCPDRVGIVSAVATLVADHRGWILEASHHADKSSGYFFMRQELRADSLSISFDEFRERMAGIAETFGMAWSLHDTARPRRVVLFCSQHDHCMVDLLYRHRTGELDADIVGVISNHKTLEAYTAWHDIPYHHIPVPKGPPEDKAPAFERMLNLCDELRADVLVLARYMQILPPSFCEAYDRRVINIHHSFLPSFVGGKPYHQAYERGVKLVGATCHYVTSDLDAGPIIEQDIIRVSQADTAEDMIRRGRDVEQRVLRQGVRLHLEDRVLVHGNKTVVFA